MKPYTSIIKMIGNTPILQISLKKTLWELYLKMEKFNPGLSMKDRMALNMINQAERGGFLKPGFTIIESSSGNTAIGLAVVSAVRGYKFIAVVDHHAAKEKLDIIQAYGGKIVFVKGNYGKGEVAIVEREETARQMCQEIPNSFCLKQADNLNNRGAYIDTLAKEIYKSISKVDVLMGPIGTGGSLSGTAEGLKKRNPKIKVIAIEPIGSTIFNSMGGPYLQSGTGNPVGADIPFNVNYSLIDDHGYVSDQEAFNTCRFFARKKGILIGGSAGGVLYKAIEYASNQEGISPVL